MYKNRAKDGRNNVAGRSIRKYRLQMPGRVSQSDLAALLLVHGLDLDKNAVQRMECGKRFITDIELKIIANALRVSYADLLDGEEAPKK